MTETASSSCRGKRRPKLLRASILGRVPPSGPIFGLTVDAVDAKDLVRVCTAWGFDVQIDVLEPLT